MALDVEKRMSPLWGSNPRPYAYEAHALPAELRRHLVSEESMTMTTFMHAERHAAVSTLVASDSGRETPL